MWGPPIWLNMPKSASAPIGVNAAEATINIKDGETTQHRQRSDINGGLQRLFGRPDRPRSIATASNKHYDEYCSSQIKQLLNQ